MTEVMTQNSIEIKTEMPLAFAKSIASLINFTDKNFERLSAIRVSIDNRGTIKAIATDRYSLIVATYDLGATVEPVEFTIGAAAAKFIAGLKGVKYANPNLSIELADGNAVIAYDGAGITERQLTEQFPEVERLFDEWQPAKAAESTAYDLTRLAKLAKVVDGAGNKVERWHLQAADSLMKGTLATPFSGATIKALMMPIRTA